MQRKDGNVGRAAVRDIFYAMLYNLYCRKWGDIIAITRRQEQTIYKENPFRVLLILKWHISFI